MTQVVEASEVGQRQGDLPIFVYGTLQAGGGASTLVKEYVIERRKAKVRGQWMRVSDDLPAVRFHPEGAEIVGEVMWFRENDYVNALEELDRYEDAPTLFERVRVVATVDQQEVEAYAYQWAKSASVVWEYINAVSRKIAIARYHLEELKRIINDKGLVWEHPPIDVQAHFEGILFAAVAAADQLAESINIGLGLGLENATLNQSLENAPKSWKLRSRLFKWHDSPIAKDYRGLRRFAIHHWSRKTTRGPRIEVAKPDGSRYPGPRSLDHYGQKVVEHLAVLEELLPKILKSLEEAAG